MKNVVVTSFIETPIGKLVAGATPKGVCMLEFTDTNRIEMQYSRLEKSLDSVIEEGESEYFSSLKEQLDSYFKGQLQCFDLPLVFHGTSFQMQAWDALMKIPYGETRSYLQQAQAIDKPKAFRAVASANRNNRISIIIPCHRVIAKNGGLAGYGGGLDRKEFLIRLEKENS